MSWVDFARAVARMAGYDPANVLDRKLSEFLFPAKRPSYSALANSRGVVLPRWETALEQFYSEPSRNHAHRRAA